APGGAQSDHASTTPTTPYMLSFRTFRWRARAAAGVLIALAPLSLPAQGDTVRYHAEFPNAAHHEARITVSFVNLDAGEPLVVRMSRSSPGRYALHEFAKNVYSVSAVDG